MRARDRERERGERREEREQQMIIKKRLIHIPLCEVKLIKLGRFTQLSFFSVTSLISVTSVVN